MTSSKNKITVFGGTGHYGRKIVEKLLQKGQAVKVVSRNGERARAILGEEVEIFQGDVCKRETITGSLKNSDAIVICLSAMSSKMFKRMKQIERDAVLTIIEEAEKQQISRLVYLSGYEMREQVLHDLGIPEFGEIKIEIEAKISSTNLNWTILGCAPSSEIFFAFIRNGKMTVPGGGLNAIPTVAAENVGEITAQAVLRDDLKGKRIRLTGPEAYSFPEAARQISILSGKRIKHLAIPLTMIHVVSFLLLPFFPFVRFIYQSLKLLNHFPRDLAEHVPKDHQTLMELFDYKPVSLEMDIRKRLEENEF